MEGINITNLLSKFNEKYFYGSLQPVAVSWSSRMTLCTGKTYFRDRKYGKSCIIKLSKPILSQRPYEDTVNTLLHEMIHSYLFLKFGKEVGGGHGEKFKSFMNKINEREGTKIRVYHNFHKEVNKFRVHIYKCNGPCRFKKPFYGTIKRAISRPPGPEDKWWGRHASECGGTFSKVNESVESGLAFVNRVTPSANVVYQRDDSTNKTSKKNCILTKGNIDKHYVSKVRCVNVKKYIAKYVEYNQKSITNNAVSKENTVTRTKFRQTLDSNIEKYIENMRNYLQANML